MLCSFEGCSLLNVLWLLPRRIPCSLRRQEPQRVRDEGRELLRMGRQHTRERTPQHTRKRALLDRPKGRISLSLGNNASCMGQLVRCGCAQRRRRWLHGRGRRHTGVCTVTGPEPVGALLRPAASALPYAADPAVRQLFIPPVITPPMSHPSPLLCSYPTSVVPSGLKCSGLCP